MMDMGAGEDSGTEYEDRLTPESLEETARQFFADLNGDEEDNGEASESDDSTDQDSDSPSVEAGDSPEGNEGGADDDDASSPSSDSALPEFFDFGENGTVSRLEVENLIAFQNFVRSNPDVAKKIADAVSGAEPNAPINNPSAPPIVTTPEGLDLDDPAIKALWDEHLAVRQRLDQLQPMVETATREINIQRSEQAVTFLKRAKDSFAKEYDLTPEDVAKVQDVAGRMNILPALMAPVDPITGLPRKVDPLAALEQSFKAAYSMMPEFEAKRLAKIKTKEREDLTRKKKLSSLAGSSGSVPKSQMQREPKTAAERRKAMIAEVAASMFGTNTGE